MTDPIEAISLQAEVVRDNMQSAKAKLNDALAALQDLDRQLLLLEGQIEGHMLREVTSGT